MSSLCYLIRILPRPTLFPYTTLFRSYAFTEITASKWASIAKDFQSLHAALERAASIEELKAEVGFLFRGSEARFAERSEEHTSELQSPVQIVCRLLLEKKNKKVEHET